MSAKTAALRSAAGRKRRDWTPLGYLSPALFSIALLSLVPVCWSIYVAFTNYSMLHFKNYEFVGLDNFRQLLSGPLKSLFFPLLGWNLAFALLTTGCMFGLGLFLALILNNPHIKEAPLYRTLLIIPWAMPGTITILVWKGMFNESFGPVNVFLRELGFKGLPFLSNPFWARVVVILVSTWFGFPYFMSLTSGALQAINHELYDAVAVDGGNAWVRFRHVSWPGIWSVVAPLLITSFSYNFNNFGIAYLITNGGPFRLNTQYAGYTDILASFGYKLTQNFQLYGLASAMGIILFFIVAVLSIYQIKLMAKEGGLS